MGAADAALELDEAAEVAASAQPTAARASARTASAARWTTARSGPAFRMPCQRSGAWRRRLDAVADPMHFEAGDDAPPTRVSGL